jgi:phosphate-selective porin OprO/OprP
VFRGWIVLSLALRKTAGAPMEGAMGMKPAGRVSAVLAFAAAVVAGGAARAQPPEAAPTPPPATAPEPAEPLEAINPLRLLSTNDLDFKFGRWSFLGYLQYDAALYAQSPPGPPEQDFRRGPEGEAGPNARELRDGGYLRRFRLGGEGNLGDDFSYRAMFDLAGEARPGDPRVYEVWLKYTRFAPYAVIVGAFAQLANMEDATSADSTLFLERATSANLARNLVAGEGRLGITLRRATPKLMVAVSLTGPVLDHSPDYSPRGAVVVRVSRALGDVQGFSVHLGGSAGYVLVPPGKSEKAPDGYPFQLKDTPELTVDPTQLVDTGVIPADHASVLGAEFAAQRGNLFLQAEAFRFGVERKVHQGADPVFYGYYVQGSWVLTGERRRFDPTRAAFWFPKPDRPLGAGGWGAWEVALRYSRMDLNFHPGVAGAPPPVEGVRGGDQKILSAALEWYPRPRTRVMLEWLHVSVDRLNPASASDPQPFGPPPATPPPGVRIGQTFDTVAMRLRYAF